MSYSYKYTPGNTQCETWIKNQKNKGLSIDLLIKKAIQDYGDGDIYNKAIEQLLNQPNSQAESKQIEIHMPTLNSDQKNEIIEENNEDNIQLKVEEKKSTPNMNFLSRS